MLVDQNNKRISKVVYGIEEAIKTKWKMLKEIQSTKKENNESNNIYKDMTLEEGFKIFFERRKAKVENNLIELSTYEDNLSVFNGRFIRNNKLLKMRIIDIGKKEAQEYIDWLYAQEPIKDGGEKLSINTIFNPFKFIHGVFTFFKDDLEII